MKKILLYFPHKTGSSFARRLFREICAATKTEYIPLVSDRQKYINVKNNYCVCLYRQYPDTATLNNSTCIIQTRDPRDILVSLYFSMGYLHPYGKQTNEIHRRIKQTDINQFVLGRAPYLLTRYNRIYETKNSKNHIMVKYEEMVLDFRKWLRKAVKPFDIDLSTFNKIYSTFYSEFQNVKELTLSEMQKNTHNRKMKRKVIPGDYLDKLDKTTINELNLVFHDILAYIGCLQ